MGEEARGQKTGRGIAFGATDALLLSCLGFITLLTVVFHSRVDGWALLALKNLAAGGIYLAVLAFGGGTAPNTRRFILRLAGVLFMLAYVNLAVAKLQLIFLGRWQDESVLRLEHAVFGVQPTIWLQQIISRPLTEWLFFTYAIYLVLYPILAVAIYIRKGERAAEDYFLTLGLTNVVGNLGFLAYPVAGPIAHLGAQYTVPLDGYVWASIGEYLRSQWQFTGGTIPSLHCANATVMGLMAYRYYRSAFWVLLPIISSLYVATVYCRYHYVTDSFAGIALALLICAVTPAFRRAWESRQVARTSSG